MNHGQSMGPDKKQMVWKRMAVLTILVNSAQCFFLFALLLSIFVKDCFWWLVICHKFVVYIHAPVFRYRQKLLLLTSDGHIVPASELFGTCYIHGLLIVEGSRAVVFRRSPSERERPWINKFSRVMRSVMRHLSPLVSQWHGECGPRLNVATGPYGNGGSLSF